MAGESHATRLRVDEAEQQVPDRGLAGAAAPEQRDSQARLEPEVEAVEHERIGGARRQLDAEPELGREGDDDPDQRGDDRG